jgi:heme exporter protein D
MNWNSTAEFLAMGGYGFYVWGAYAVTLALMLAEPLLARRRHRRALDDAADAADAATHTKAANQGSQA